ncbi:MAG: sulfatase-like hydrolase/transferase [Spirochaetes bacterium]|nr:sulfatase-like hydrolase/transferase [Spirochaetota bacterium]
MKKFISRYSNFKKNTKEKFYPASPLLMLLFLIIYLFSWNLSFFIIAAGVIFGEIISGTMILFCVYILASIITVMIMSVVFYSVSVSWIRKTAGWIFLLLFACTGIIRMIDWGAIYYDNQHIDSEFWFHAFYVDGTAFLFTKVSVILMLVFIFSLIVFKKLSGLLSYYCEKIKNGEASVPGYSGKKTNLVFSGILSASIILFALFSSRIPQNITDQGSRLYLGSPVYHFSVSLYEYFFQGTKKNVETLPETVIAKLEKAGIKPGAYNPDYPLMRESIYIDKKNKSDKKPVLNEKTNVIIIFEESLSQFYLEENELGYAGLTPNLHEAISRGIYFKNMYESIFPTIRGMIATLGSSLYVPAKSNGIQTGSKTQKAWLPIFCRFSFLSDILKDYGYTSVHVQGGSGTFVGMSSAFTKNQNYSKFYAQESLELLKYSGTDNYNAANWGYWDEDVFGFSVDLLKNKKIKEPFLLSISTLDLHPPFVPKVTTPAAKGKALLNTLYSTDQAFGILWDYYKNSDLKNNTVIIVVADHAMGGGDEFLELRRESLTRQNKLNSENLMDDFITCFMVLPGNKSYEGTEVDTFCSNLDIAPTLLDMMNIDVPNSFLGMSVFADRINFPNLVIAEYKLRSAVVQERLTEAQKKIINEYSFTNEEQDKFRSYMENLAMKRMIYPDEKK